MSNISSEVETNVNIESQESTVERVNEDNYESSHENTADIIEEIESQIDVEEDFEVNDIIDDFKTNLNSRNRAQRRAAERANKNKVDQRKVKQIAKETVASIEKNARQIEKNLDFTIDRHEYETNKSKYKHFIFDNDIHGITNEGIMTNKFISEYDIYGYNWSNGPNSALMIEIPTQLVLVHKLNRLFGFKFLQESEVSIKFNNLDKMVCSFIKQNQIPTYKLPYDILKSMLKKTLVASLTNVEQAFRSDKIWISPSFKKFVLEDIIIMESLSDKLKTSFKIFHTELLKTKNAKVFNNTKILDYLVHTIPDFELEEILASSIKCMTPCFILDYFNAIKSFYLFASLLNIYMNKISKKEIKYQQEDVLLIAKICSIIYQNTRLNQNTTGRQLPAYNDKISETTQMYYLNHTIVGPQFLLLKLMEKSVICIDDIIKI